ncbi:MAG: cytochrome c3 family protein [Deltaproteobacteria bacterium]|nr:cytochrome c3 family protein [Deltaproteobacteria bacterium]MBW2070574.1 cytochrome c3 family protein [Deltaproteobacteria bacterium]
MLYRGRLLVWIAVLAGGGLLLAMQLQAQPEEIVLQDQVVFGQHQRPPVAFPHMLHIDADLDCTTCHHRFQRGENVLDESELEEGAEGISCSSCHKNSAGFQFSPEVDPTKKILRQAYHRMCIGCHRGMRKKEVKGGPVACGECHIRPKSAQP